MLDVHRIDLDAPAGTTWRLYSVGDIHAGNRHCRERDLAATVESIASDRFARWVGLGDYGDWIGYRDDKRFAAYECAPWLDISDPWQSTLEWLEVALKPIAPQCLGLIRGNHEQTIARTMQFHVQAALSNRLGVTDLGDLVWLRLMFHTSTTQRHMRDILAVHGWGGGRTGGARVNKLEQLMSAREADVYIMAHAHGQTPVIRRRITYLDKRGHECSRDQFGVQSGTYLDGAEYERRAGYAPSVIGSPVVAFFSCNNGIHTQVTV